MQIKPEYIEGARQALQAWELSDPELTLVSHSENIVFRVDSAEQAFALRIHRPGYHTLEELESEQAWTAALAAAGIDVPVAHRTLDGRVYVQLPMGGDGRVHHFGLVQWLSGEPLRARLARTQDRTIWQQAFSRLGRIAGLMHTQASGWTPPAGFQRHAFDAEGLMGDDPFWGRFWNQPTLSTGERRIIEKARVRIYQLLQAYGRDPSIYSLIHADLHPGNLLASAEKLRVIDFDDSGSGWHAYDLAVGLFNYQDEPYFDQIRDALFAGYRSVRALDPTIVELLPLFLLIRALALLGWIMERPELAQEHRLPGLIRRALTQIDMLGLVA